MKMRPTHTPARCLQVSACCLAWCITALGVSPDALQQGQQLFERDWPGRSATLGNDGLGPLFNATSCVACHHQGGVGGGGDARFNAFAVGIESLSFSGTQTSRLPDNATKLALIRDFFPAFINSDGSIQNTAPLPHRGGSPEFHSWRNFFRASTEALLSEEGGPPNAAEVRVSLNTPLFYTAVWNGVLLSTKARVFQRNTTPLFGAGLIDTIPQAAIERQEKIQRRHSEISGRPSILRDGSLGRFGWRGNATNLIRFVDRACANELSLETKRRTQGTDPARPNYRNPSIDITDDQIRMMSSFIAALPRPIQQMPASPDKLREVSLGQQAFHAVGCAVCHVPSLGNVDGLYSDLLLHDMGTELYDYDAAEPHVISQRPSTAYRFIQGSVREMPYYGSPTSITGTTLVIPNQFVSPRSSQSTSDFVTVATSSEVDRVVLSSAPGSRSMTAGFRDEIGIERKLTPSNTSQEWRTPPLWGVRDSAPYMHDGRAATLLEAITLHDGESAGSRDRFLQLPVVDRHALIAFLETLVAPPNAPQADL